MTDGGTHIVIIVQTQRRCNYIFFLRFGINCKTTSNVTINDFDRAKLQDVSHN